MITLPGGVTVNVQFAKYDVWYPMINFTPNATISYSEDFLLLSVPSNLVDICGNATSQLVSNLFGLVCNAIPEAKPFLSFASGCLTSWIVKVVKDSNGGITLAFAPHWAGTCTNGVDLNYLGVVGWDSNVKAVTNLLKSHNDIFGSRDVGVPLNIPNMRMPEFVLS
ncbi:hypothetical protein [Chromobacterium haemolyticum]|uniref:hypothetical protein n=1 Tax=Chromobacterium haemolyticum TaxID=394935 RepID=UPI001130521E|nr:hypothetical protein [Chromobacterium haemolyticum]